MEKCYVRPKGAFGKVTVVPLAISILTLTVTMMPVARLRANGRIYRKLKTQLERHLIRLYGATSIRS